MAFFLSTQGQLHPYDFKYLDSDFTPPRLEKTEIHSVLPRPAPSPPIKSELDIYAIDIMNSPVFSMTTHSFLNEIRSEMSTRNIRHIPILEKNKLVGIISDRDLLRVNLKVSFMNLKAFDIMTTVLVVTDEETPLSHIARVLTEEKISVLPVINKHHILTGIISRTDILRAVVNNRLVTK